MRAPKKLTPPTKAKLKPSNIKICAFVDYAGTSFSTPEQEYEEIREFFQDLFKRDFMFKTQVSPFDLANQSTDLYVIDYGGLMPGAEDGIRSLFREFVRQVEDKPDTLFILWSSFSERWYRDIMEADAKDIKDHFNVLFDADSPNCRETFDKVVEWLKAGGKI